MKKQELIKRYVREAGNLNHNIKFELNKTPWDGETNHKLIEYMKGQLSVLREIVHILRNEEYFLYNQAPLDYKLGEPIN